MTSSPPPPSAPDGDAGGAAHPGRIGAGAGTPATRLRPVVADAWLGTALRLGGLVVTLWAVADETHPGLHGRHLAAALLLVACALGWVGWLMARRAGTVTGITAAALAMGAAGGVLALIGSTAIVFVGAAGMAAGLALPVTAAVAVTAVGATVLAGAGLATGAASALLVGGVAAALGGLVIGVSRRQTIDRALQESAMDIERERAELARERAGVLAERNRLAGELHDVLAHTLGALAVQLQAVDSLLGSDRADEAAAALATTRHLVLEGMHEARQAVRALREDPTPLADRVRALADQPGVTAAVAGEPRQLAAEPALALWRAAQEGVSNARKHAPGSPVAVTLAYGDGAVRLTVTNDAARRPRGQLADTGGGYGLQGMRERVLLLGGRVEAGPSEGGGWRLAVEVPE